MKVDQRPPISRAGLDDNNLLTHHILSLLRRFFPFSCVRARRAPWNRGGAHSVQPGLARRQKIIPSLFRYAGSFWSSKFLEWKGTPDFAAQAST
jgi:hypothetical protein